MLEYEDSRHQIYDELYNYIKKGFNVVIEVDKMKHEDIKLKHIESLIKKANALNLPLNLFVSGYSQFGKESEHVEMLFSQKLINTFIALNTYLESNHQAPLRFLEDPLHPQNAWTLNQVINANEEINAVADIIKLQKFTPYEAMAYIHYYLTSQFPYSENVEDPMKPRSIIGLLNSENIVCVGYAKFIKAVVDKLDMEGLSAETIESVIKPDYPKEKAKMVNIFPISGFAHLQNLITINDPKYNINGTYMNDACWDTKNEEFEFGKGFGNFMYSVNDAFNYAGLSYQQVDQVDDFEATKILESEEVIDKKDMPFYQKYSKKSKQIPSETFERCLGTMLKKIYPSMGTKEVKKSTEYYMLLSRLVAASIFNEKSENQLAREGREIQKQLPSQKKIDSKEIIK